MKRINLFTLLFALILIIFSSCSKEYIIVEESDYSGNSRMNIRTRAISDDAIIAYPVYIYVFDSDNKYVSSKTIESADDDISFDLIEGLYKVYAIGGITSGNYEIPTDKNVTPESVVALIDGKEHGDIMTANNTIVLQDGEENTLTLSLERKVILLQDVVIYNVPTKVSEVTMTIAPLYENVCINGTLDGENGMVTKTLSSSSGTKTWTNSEDLYILENSDNVTITVSMKFPDGTKSYSYSCPEKFLANYKLKIFGAYTESVGVTLNGVLSGATWAGEKEISFSFDESGSSDGIEQETPNVPPTDDEEDTEQPSTGGEVSGNIPSVGEFYNGCYVLKHDNGANNTTVVTLVSSKTKKLSFTKGDQSSLKSAVNDALSSFDVEGISGWRLPNETEVAYIRENSTAINENFVAGGKGYAFVEGSCYFYEKSDEIIYSFTIQNLPAGWSFDSGASDFLRPVTTMTFSNN